MPSSKSIYEERRELLDKLMDLPLKGFPDLDATPSSGITSLPTPHIDDHPQLEEPVESSHLQNAPTERQHIIYPSTPHLKDLDSFTEGTGGSFDFLADEDVYENTYTLNTLALSLLPPERPISIESWREDVFYNSPDTSQPPSRSEEQVESECPSSDSLPHSKRPRSIASDDVARRTKPRAQSMYSSPSSMVMSFYAGVEPPPADVRPLVRPHLRRTRSLPLRPD